MAERTELDALFDVKVFAALEPQARQTLASQAARALGPSFRPQALAPDAAASLDALPFLDDATGLVFHLVPGGRLEMGLTPEDEAALAREIQNTEAIRELGDRYRKILRPARRVEVAPFLITPGPLSNQDAARLSGNRHRRDTFGRAGARELAHSLGLRLPSEAEREWLARDGGQHAFTLDCVEAVRSRREPRSRFGVRDLWLEEWLDDDWHLTYAGAPATSAPWLDGDPRGVYRGGLLLSAVQSESEFFFALSALRFPGPRVDDAGARDSAGDPLAGIEEETEPDAVARLALPFPA